MNDALDSILTYYHPLCDINLDNVDPQSKERICPRSAIKILTYNIFLRPPPIKTNENDWKDERMYEFIKHFPQFDIICLQEMFGTFNSRKHDLIRFAVKSGFFFFVDTPSPSFLSKYLVDGGLVILSRFPIIESAFIPFKYGVLSDSLAQKGVLYAKIEIKNTILHLFTTHLQASYFGSTEYHWNVSYTTRINQLEQTHFIVNELLKKHNYKESHKVILLGDFNCDAQHYRKKREALKTHYDIENEYDNMMQLLNKNGNIVYDTFLRYKSMHPITYGDYDEENKFSETVLTSPEDQGSCFTLDYIFELFKCEDDATNAEKNKNLTINGDSLTIEKFLVSGAIYSQLSDHYGLSVEVIYKDSNQLDKNENNEKDGKDEETENLVNNS